MSAEVKGRVTHQTLQRKGKSGDYISTKRLANATLVEHVKVNTRKTGKQPQSSAVPAHVVSEMTRKHAQEIAGLNDMANRVANELKHDNKVLRTKNHNLKKERGLK